MKTEKPPDETGNANQGGAAGGAGTPPPAASGGQAAGGGAPPTPPAGQPPTPPAGTKAEPRDIGESGEGQPREVIQLTTEALNARISRASKQAVAATMKEVFGTEDPQAVKAQLAELGDLKKKEDDQRRATLTEIDRVKEDNSRLLARATNAEARINELEEAQALAGDEQEIKAVADKHIDPEYWDVAKTKLADHLSANYSSEELDALSVGDREKLVDEFFSDYAKKKPALAKKAPAAGGAGGGDGGTQTQQQGAGGGNGAPPEKRPLTNGGANPRGRGNPNPPAVIQSGPFAGKTAAPGHPNSMTATEFAQWKKATGNTY